MSRFRNDAGVAVENLVLAFGVRGNAATTTKIANTGAFL
jgi:hypothetical protein